MWDSGKLVRWFDKMYGTRTTQRTSIKQTQHEVGVTEKDLEKFRRLNHDDAQVREVAQFVKVKKAEMRDYPNDIAIILHKKTEQLAAIKRNVNTIVSVGNTVGLLALGGTSTVVSVLNLVRDNNGDLARFILPYFEPDLSLEQEGVTTGDKAVVVSNARMPDVSGILQKFHVPEGIAADVQDIYEKGPAPENIASVVSHLFTRFMTKKETHNAEAFDY